MITAAGSDHAAIGALFGAPELPARQSLALDDHAVWALLQNVLDPEVPVLSVVELGIVREVTVAGGGAVTLVVTPTYSGCPATEAIADAIRAALLSGGAASVDLQLRHAPAWTTDWLGPEARDKLRRYGIAPPDHLVGHGDEAGGGLTGTQGTTSPLRFHPRGIACPRCGSVHSEQLSAFGATACKALYRCLACREPFEYFKPL